MQDKSGRLLAERAPVKKIYQSTRHVYKVAAPDKANNRAEALISRITTFLGFASLIPALAFCYSIGFLLPIDPAVVQLFTASDLLRFAGYQSPMAILIVVMVTFLVTSFYRSRTFIGLRSRFLVLSQRFQSIFLLGSTLVMTSILVIINANVFYNSIDIGFRAFMQSACFPLLVIIVYILILYAHLRIDFRLPSQIHLTFGFAMVFSLIFCIGAIMSSTVIKISKKDPLHSRICVKLNKITANPILKGDDYTLVLLKDNEYDIWKTKDVAEFVMIKTRSADNSDNPCV